MYYLQSRYYDPEVARFINADDPSIIDSGLDYSIITINKFAYCSNNPIEHTDEYGTFVTSIIKMIGNFILGMAGGMLGLYLANITLNMIDGKNNPYDKNDTWGEYIAEGIKSGVFSIFGSKYLIKVAAVVGATSIRQLTDYILSKKVFNWQQFLTDVFVGIIMVTIIHFAPNILNRLSKVKKKKANKILEKILSLAKKIVNYIMEKLKVIIDRVLDYFKNIFIKRFSISYAKKIGVDLLELFT